MISAHCCHWEIGQKGQIYIISHQLYRARETFKLRSSLVLFSSNEF